MDYSVQSEMPGFQALINLVGGYQLVGTIADISMELTTASSVNVGLSSKFLRVWCSRDISGKEATSYPAPTPLAYRTSFKDSPSPYC